MKIKHEYTLCIAILKENSNLYLNSFNIHRDRGINRGIPDDVF